MQAAGSRSGLPPALAIERREPYTLNWSVTVSSKQDMKDQDLPTEDTAASSENTPNTSASAAPQPETAADAEALEAAQMTEVEAELAKLKADAAEYLEGWQRARAEFTNYRKRVDREKEDMFLEARITVLAKFLPVIDDFARAIENIPEELIEHNWTQGVRLVNDKFATLLQNNGLVEINPVGELFDPMQHEAVGMDDNPEVESGHITIVLQKGYAYGDKVLRPAMVRVAN